MLANTSITPEEPPAQTTDDRERRVMFAGITFTSFFLIVLASNMRTQPSFDISGKVHAGTAPATAAEIRVAVLVSGQPRTLTMCLQDELFPKKLQPMLTNADVPWLDYEGNQPPVATSIHKFLYSWLQNFDVFFMISFPGDEQRTLSQEIRKQKADKYCNALRPKNETHRIFCQARNNDVTMEYTEEIMGKFVHKGKRTLENGLLQQLYGLYYVNKMRKEHEKLTGVRYTHIIRLRPDVIIARSFPSVASLDFGSSAAPNILYASDLCCCGNQDWFGIGTSEVMNYYFDRILMLFQTFDRRWQEGLKVWTAEAFLEQILKSQQNATLVPEDRIVACIIKPISRKGGSEWRR